MINDLFSAIKMDLDSYPIKNEMELKAYCRYLLGLAYMGKDSDTNTSKYVKQRGKDSVNLEIQNMVFMGSNILNYDKLLNKAADNIVDDYLKDSKTNDEAYSFKEIMEKTLSYYLEKGKFVASSIGEVKNFAEIILRNYFYDSQVGVKVFSRNNGMRSCVFKKGKSAILQEMQKDLNVKQLSTNVDDLLISLYANFISNSWFLKYINNKKAPSSYDDNGLDSISRMIKNEIYNANLNDKQKKWLLDEFLNGNVDCLERYVSKQLIDEYIKLSSNKEQGNYSK